MGHNTCGDVTVHRPHEGIAPFGHAPAPARIKNPAIEVLGGGIAD